MEFSAFNQTSALFLGSCSVANPGMEEQGGDGPFPLGSFLKLPLNYLAVFMCSSWRGPKRGEYGRWDLSVTLNQVQISGGSPRLAHRGRKMFLVVPSSCAFQKREKGTRGIAKKGNPPREGVLLKRKLGLREGRS
uniref:Uncharacterized protein n=1 Tax=Sphaerodactylus townsendi TaxID=933632 RepID=A0ACB8FSP4_9SAUR